MEEGSEERDAEVRRAGLVAGGRKTVMSSEPCSLGDLEGVARYAVARIPAAHPYGRFWSGASVGARSLRHLSWILEA